MHRLTAGDPAPTFRKNDYLGAEVSLPTAGTGNVFLSFYRYASCPMCNLRTRELILAIERFDAANISMIAVWQSPAAEISKQMETHKPPFPVIADPAFELYRAYGVESSVFGLLKAARRTGDVISAIHKGFLPGKVDGPIHRIPADFLIGPDGKIIDAYYGNDAGDHMPLERVFSKL